MGSVGADVEEAGTLSDAALLAAIAARDQRAFVALYDRYGRLVFRRAYHLLREIGSERILVKDGPYGSMIQTYRLDE